MRRLVLSLALLSPVALVPHAVSAQPAGHHAAGAAVPLGTRVQVARPAHSAHDPRDEIVYELFVRNATAEGTFRAATAMLPQVKALGTTTVWLMPIHPVGQTGRKGTFGSPYSIADYRGVNPDLGTMDDVRAFVAEAHRLGMKVILDLVANHTAWDHPWLAQHPDWYTKGPDGRIVPPNPDWTDVADLNYDVPAMRAAMMDDMLFWVRDVGIDGYRCDVAELVPADFWREAIARLRAVKPVLMLAEGATDELYEAGFDLTYDWPLYQAMKRVWQGGPLAELHGPLAAAAPKLRFTTNHDETAWDAPPLHRFNGTLGAMAAFWTVALLPGAPLVYNGQEHGHPNLVPLFEHVPATTVDFRTRDQYEAALLLREAHPVLREGALTLLDAGNDGVLLFERTRAGERVLVAVNVRPQSTVYAPSEALRATYNGTPEERRGRRVTARAIAPVRTAQVVTPALWDGTEGDAARVTAPLALPARVDLAPYEVRTWGTVVLRTR